MSRKRLDDLLVEGGFFDTREKARRSIMAGLVTAGGRRIEKPGTLVASDRPIEVSGGEKFVGRGGLKLEAALDAFGVAPAGRICLDIGSSTGGFTDCLLQRGAARVHAVDVGRGQLSWKLRNNPRVVVHEGVNARHLTRSDVPDPVSLLVADVSFISLTLILPPAFGLMEPKSDIIVLIKPQFELPASDVDRGGVVRDAALREHAVAKIRDFALASGRDWQAVIESPIRGREGNVEFLAHLLS